MILLQKNLAKSSLFGLMLLCAMATGVLVAVIEKKLTALLRNDMGICQIKHNSTINFKCIFIRLPYLLEEEKKNVQGPMFAVILWLEILLQNLGFL